ncbi:MAG TPA: hypothetical protein VKU00_03340, partial [Chthonomonadaceae bacterium]|nr:hypothetical protein [Chthonomonadaceae bacterium]
MKRFGTALILILVVMQGAKAQTTIALPQVSDIGFCKPYTWLFGGWVAPPRIPLLGDINGDGYADFLYASPQDKSIDVSLNGKGWKPLRGQRLISDLPQKIRAMCLGHFGGKTLDLAILGKEGELCKALSTQNGEFPASTSLGTVNGLAGKVWLLAGKVASSNLDDILVVDSTGRAQVFDAAGAKLRDYALHLPVTDAAEGDVLGDGRAD